MKASINAPVVSVHDRTYQAQCQFSLEPSIAGLVAMAEKAGWSRRHTLLAVMMLASAMMEAEAPVALAMPAVAALQ